MAGRPKKKAKAGYMISAVADLYKLHPQTLRLYERVGLLKPSRSQGNTRLYTDSDLERLEVILNLTRERVRQLEMSALEKIRQAGEDAGLGAFEGWDPDRSDPGE